MIPEESLIKPEDLQEIQSFKTDPLDIQHVRYIVDKVEKDQKDTNKKKEPFKPYKTTRSNVHDPAKEKQRKLPKNWEITAATPPLIVHEAAKVLSLDESFRLQQEQTEKRKVCFKPDEALFEALLLLTLCWNSLTVFYMTVQY